MSGGKHFHPSVIYGHVFIYAALGFIATIIKFSIVQDIILKDFKILVVSTMFSLVAGFLIINISSVSKKLQYAVKKIAVLSAIAAVVLLIDSYSLIILSVTSISVFGTYLFTRSLKGA